MPNKFLVRNGALSEFVYDLLYNISDEQRKKLSKPFSLLCKSDTKARNFAEFSTLDEKVRLFNELGMDNALVFFQDKIKSVNRLKEILLKYEENKQAGAAKEIVALKVFVSSDKNVTWLLGLMADTIHHKSYFLNQQFNKIGYHIKEWSKKKEIAGSIELNEAVENSDLLVSLFLNSLENSGYAESYFGVRELDLKILMYLYGYRHTHIEKDRMRDFFGVGVRSKGKVTTSVKRLFNAGHIKKHTDYSVPKYTISSSGIKIVNQFVDKILTQTKY